MVDLLNCPFCGGTELYWPHGTDPAIIECGGNGCGARSGVPGEQQESEAIALWNTRTPDPAQIRADALQEAAALMEVAATNCRAAFTYPPRTKEERDYQTAALVHTYARDAILALLDAPLSPTAVDNRPAPDAGTKGQDQ